jgi:hypothetical protein
MNDSPVRMVIAGIAAIVLLLAILKLVGCGHASSTDTQLQIALDVLADTIAPASRISAEACTARERVEVAEAEAGSQTLAQARADLVIVRRRCNVLRETFERMADAHARARTLVDQGALAEARARLEEVRALWRSLAMEGTP